MTELAFSSLPLNPEQLANLESLAYHQMTPIQAQSLPIMLEGGDLLAQAKTGSGKTAAFALTILHKLEASNYQTQALVLCPTRELADQVCNEIRRLARAIPNVKILSLCGGKPIGAQYASLERNAHIVVGTPGRILKHVNKGSLRLDKLQTLVLDEADRMLDMGFLEDIMLILDATPRARQTLLFSATYPEGIQRISQVVQQNPVEVRVEGSHQNPQIKQVFYQVDSQDRNAALVALLQHYQPESSLVFCTRKQQCQDLADALVAQGFHALALHGDLEQYHRDQVLVQFANKSSSVLIATDVAARGLDIQDLSAVINYELTQDPQMHIHRIGRTGRAGNDGLALSLFTNAERHRLEAIEVCQDSPAKVEKISSLKKPDNFKLYPPMVTLCINAGRKDKIRAGDILGALTANTDLPGSQVGKIDLLDKQAYVAVTQAVAKQALKIISEGKIKGRSYRVKRLR